MRVSSTTCPLYVTYKIIYNIQYSVIGNKGLISCYLTLKSITVNNSIINMLTADYKIFISPYKKLGPNNQTLYDTKLFIITSSTSWCDSAEIQ